MFLQLQTSWTYSWTEFFTWHASIHHIKSEHHEKPKKLFSNEKGFFFSGFGFEIVSRVLIFKVIIIGVIKKIENRTKIKKKYRKF